MVPQEEFHDIDHSFNAIKHTVIVSADYLDPDKPDKEERKKIKVEEKYIEEHKEQ